MVILIALATLVSTFLGGLFALKFRDKLHLILSFSAGAVIGVAFFDLIPESIELIGQNHTVSFAMGMVALGFSIYMILDRTSVLHSHNDEDCKNLNHRGKIGVGSLSAHSFLDGVAIGLAFQVSPSVGAIVAVAVLVHDFSDGINTVGLVLKNNGDIKTAFKWLTLDAIAPVLGVISTLFFSLSQSSLGLVLAVFSGFFLYIGASDLLPESHHQHPSFLNTLITLLGIAVLFVAIRLAAI